LAPGNRFANQHGGQESNHDRVGVDGNRRHGQGDVPISVEKCEAGIVGL
jgi:hypothetical protein